jgi:hypothetical protein
MNICTTIEQRGVVRFLWAKKYGSKRYPQRNATHMGNICTTMEQRGVVRFLWAKKYGCNKGYPQRNAAHMGNCHR